MQIALKNKSIINVFNINNQIWCGMVRNRNRPTVNLNNYHKKTNIMSVKHILSCLPNSFGNYITNVYRMAAAI